MSTSMRVSTLVAALGACLLALPAFSQDVDLSGSLKFSGAPTPQELQAQQKACEAKKPPRRSAGALTEGTFRRLERTMQQIAKNQYPEAEKTLAEMLADSGRSEYEKGIIQQTLGYVYASTNREMLAVKAFEQAVATNSLPQAIHEALMFNIAQLYISDDKAEQGMQRLNAYLAESCNPNPDAHILLASVYAEKKQWRDSLKQADLAIVKAKAPKESWLQLKLALHYELKELPRCAEVLVHLVALNPVKPDYFRQLSGMLLQIGKDPEAMAVLALAERRGL
ncbi:MAG: tetratricopeptide repeat protein, partial [Nevskiaceae bacterium]